MKYKRKHINNERLRIQCFEEMFKDKNDIACCVELLQKVIPAVVDDSEHYLHKVKKSPIVAWRNVLLQCGYIYYLNDEITADILNRKFKNLNIKEASFRTVQSRVYDEYQMQFLYHIPPKVIQFEDNAGNYGRLASSTKREIS